jgi:hypothetical protein
MHICCVMVLCGSIVKDYSVIFSVLLLKSPFYYHYYAKFCCDLTRIFLDFLVLANLVGLFFRNMATGSPQRRVPQRTEEYRAAIRAKIMDHTDIAEQNVVRSDIMVAPLDSIHDIIQTYHWGYLHNCACVVYTRLVRLFYANLEVVQNDDHGVVLQSTVDGHIITVDPQIISQFIGVPVLQISDSPYNEVVLPPSMDDLREFFRAIPQGEEHATTIRIGALSPSRCMLVKIV